MPLFASKMIFCPFLSIIVAFSALTMQGISNSLEIIAAWLTIPPTSAITPFDFIKRMLYAGFVCLQTRIKSFSAGISRLSSVAICTIPSTIPLLAHCPLTIIFVPSMLKEPPFIENL